jgi:hypothetical protein
VETEFPGERFLIEREGTDGDVRRASARIAELPVAAQTSPTAEPTGHAEALARAQMVLAEQNRQEIILLTLVGIVINALVLPLGLLRTGTRAADPPDGRRAAWAGTALRTLITLVIALCQALISKTTTATA